MCLGTLVNVSLRKNQNVLEPILRQSFVFLRVLYEPFGWKCQLSSNSDIDEAAEAYITRHSGKRVTVGASSVEIAMKKALPYLSNAYCQKAVLCIEDVSVREKDLYTYNVADAAKLQKWVRRSMQNTSIGTLTLEMRHVTADSVTGEASRPRGLTCMQRR